jgi:hypothetical protein
MKHDELRDCISSTGLLNMQRAPDEVTIIRRIDFAFLRLSS